MRYLFGQLVKECPSYLVDQRFDSHHQQKKFLSELISHVFHDALLLCGDIMKLILGNALTYALCYYRGTRNHKNVPGHKEDLPDWS